MESRHPFCENKQKGRNIMENVVMVLFNVESEAYQALAQLKRDPVNANYTISQIGLVKKQNGRILPLEGFDSGVNTTDDTLAGGLIGSLIGILGGPLGVLFSGSVGALLGSSLDTEDALKNASMLEKVSEKLQDDQVALAALIQEDDETVFDRAVSGFNTEIMRWDAASIAAEVEEAEKLEKEMRRTAREELRKKKKEERKQDFEQRRAKIHMDIENFKVKFQK